MVSIPPEHAALLPVYVLTAVGALLPLLGAFDGRRGGMRVRGGVLAALAALGIVAAMVLTLGMVWDIPGLGFLPQVTPQGDPVVSFALLEMTPFVVLFDLVFLAVALIVTLGSPRYIGRHQGEYYSLVILGTIGMMVVAASRDLITLFIGIELSSLCSFALAGYFKNRLDSSEAAMKYFLIGSISAALALFGISMVYGLTGGTSFEHLAGIWDDPLRGDAGATTIGDQLLAGRFTIGVFIWGLLLAGFGYKVAFVPFHNYAVDVYEGAPNTVGGFLAAGSKQMGFAALFKVFFLGLLAVKANWDMVVGVLAIVTMIVGNVAALQQTNIKRMLAYSSIAQAGYILLALAVGTEYALAGGLFHIVTYSFMKAGAFIALAAAATWGIGEEMSDWKGLSKRAPYLALAMAVFMLSFAGIPPLAGFASKFVLFSSAILAASSASTAYATLFYALAVAGIVTSAISLVYYWRLIRVMYVEEGEGRRIVVTSAAGVAVTIALLATVLIGIFPTLALDMSLEAAAAMFQGLATTAP